MQLPNKIIWRVDLERDDGELFPGAIIRRITRDRYKDEVAGELLSCTHIKSLFLPMYIRLIMDRRDFRLDTQATLTKFDQMSMDSSYRLYWFTTRGGNTPLGGIVVHTIPSELRVAYRAFDHELAKSNGTPELDYYAELMLRRTARQMGYDTMTHGSERHPLTQLGLSNFKLRMGMLPAVHSVTELVEFDITRHVGYYADPVNDLYSKFYLYRDERTGVEKSFCVVAARSGIEVVRAV